MRRLVPRHALSLSLAFAVLAAGCIEALPGATDDAPAPAETEGDDAEGPVASAPADGGEPEPAAAQDPASGNATTNGAANATSPSSPPPADPAPPAPAPWALAAEVRLGFTEGAAAPGQEPVVAQGDADHCPGAGFVLPGGAAALVLTLAGEPASAAPSVGHVAVDVRAPDGTLAATLDPVAARLPAESGAQGATTVTLDAPAAGTWTLQARPVGPVVAHAWTVTLDASGESVAAPASLEASTACA